MLGRRLPSFVERAAFCSSNNNTTTTREAKIATEGGEEDEDDESALDMISSRRSDDDDARIEDNKEEERGKTRGEDERRTRINEDFDETSSGNAFRATETTTLEKKKKNRVRGGVSLQHRGVYVHPVQLRSVRDVPRGRRAADATATTTDATMRVPVLQRLVRGGSAIPEPRGDMQERSL